MRQAGRVPAGSIEAREDLSCSTAMMVQALISTSSLPPAGSCSFAWTCMLLHCERIFGPS